MTKARISQSALCTFASAFMPVTLALCVKCQRTLKGTINIIFKVCLACAVSFFFSFKLKIVYEKRGPYINIKEKANLINIFVKSITVVQVVWYCSVNCFATLTQQYRLIILLSATKFQN